MKYKTAMAEVFGRFPSPRARSAAIGLLAKYADPVRPVTAWHAVGDDAKAGVALLEALGFSEGTDYKVVRSELDPSAVRVGWTESGLELLAAVPRELAGFSLEPAQRAVLCAGRGDPLALVPDDTDSARTAEPAEPEPPGGGLRDAAVEMTRAVARRLIAALGNNPYAGNDAPVLEWAESQLRADPSSTSVLVPTPMAPLAALETLARAEGAQWLPPHRMFEPMPAMLPENQASRLVRADEAVPAGRINCMPLAEQATDVTSSNIMVGPLRGYLAWTLDDWAKFPRDGDAVWTQFDARLCRTAEALNYALDAVRMREFVRRLVEHGYPGWRCGVDSTTRLAVCNTANGGVPGSENLETEDGDNSPLQDRIEECDCRVDELVYTGAFVASDKVVGDGVLSAEFANSATHPVAIAGGGDEPDESAARGRGLEASEMAQEWFMLVHGGEPWPTTDMTWRSVEDRAQNRTCNLARFRNHIGSMTDADMLHYCSPENPLYAGDANRSWTVPGAVVNGLCAAIRHHAGPGLQFVEDSPHWPDRMIAGVWSGLMSDLAPDTPQGADDDDVFPRIPTFSFSMGTGHVDNAPGAAQMTGILCLLHRKPGIQLRFGRRTKGVHREHAVVFETNVRAKPFLDAVDGAEFRSSVLRLFKTTLLRRLADPLAGVPTHAPQPAEGMEVSAAREWIDQACPGLRREFELNLASDGWFEIGWREDALGRLVLVVWTRVPEAAQRAKLAYRCAKCLPVASAAWLAAHGAAGASSLTLDPDLAPLERYRRVLAAALKQRGFASDVCVTTGLAGRLSPMWIVDAAWDLDYDEIPSHHWYDVHPEALVNVEQFLR